MASGKPITLPGGRGQMTSAENIQNENIRQRSLELAESSWEYATTAGDYVNVAGPTVARLYMVHSKLGNETRATHVALRFGVAVAGQTWKAALYTPVFTPTVGFKKIPYTEIAPSTAHTFIQVLELDNEAYIQRGLPIFVGWITSHANARIDAAYVPRFGYFYVDGYTELPIQIERSLFTRYTGSASVALLPALQYFSANAARLI